MTDQHDGGPAFPVADERGTPGMSLLAWYAGMAIDAAYTHALVGTDVPRMAFDIAEAMIRELRRREGR